MSRYSSSHIDIVTHVAYKLSDTHFMCGVAKGKLPRHHNWLTFNSLFPEDVGRFGWCPDCSDSPMFQLYLLSTIDL